MKRQVTQLVQTAQDDQFVIPNQFYCPITLQIMVDPVILEDGFSYERRAIQSWLAKQSSSPATGLMLTSKTLTPNLTLRNSIVSFKQNFLPLINKQKIQGKYLINVIKFKDTILCQKEKQFDSLTKERQRQKLRSHILENQLSQLRQFKSINQQQLIKKNLQLAHQLFKEKQEKNNKINQIRQLKRIALQPLRYQTKISIYNQKLQSHRKKQAQLQQQINNTFQAEQDQSILQAIFQFLFGGSKTQKVQQVEYLDYYYRGRLENKEPHGIGRVVDNQNNTYIGYFQKGQRTGFGKHKWVSGDVYRGQFLQGKAQGFGVYRWRSDNPKQQQYQGDFKDDQFDGFGKIYYRGTAEERYQGQWKQGKRHGYGILFYRNQQVYAGNFQANQKHGQGRFINNQGQQYFQTWDNGRLCNKIIIQK